MRDEFESDGCVLIKGILTDHDLMPVDHLLLTHIRQHVPDATDIQDPAWTRLATQQPGLVAELYDAVRDQAVTQDIGRLPGLREVVASLLEYPALYFKVPLRIDVPFENKELAFWHQDDFYVRGNNQELTVWIPLQDTLAHHGALSVMKGSHRNGPIPHSLRVGKKMLPVGIFDAPIHIVEMQRGDVLVFSSHLVHSSNLNISNQIRYSLQLRYSDAKLGKQSGLMGGFSNV